MDRQRRRELGAWYTPPELVDAVVTAALDDWTPPRGRPVVVLDPACGDGRFLVAAHDALRRRGLTTRLMGVDIDPEAVSATRSALAQANATVLEADALGPSTLSQFVGGVHTAVPDLVVGNPPFLSPLARRNGKVASTSPAGSPYADAATQFVLRAWDVLGPGGRLGFVLPQSVLANRDAAVARAAIAADGGLRWLWWSPRSVFEAAVRTCAVVAERGAAVSRVRRSFGPRYAPAADAEAVAEEWSALVADLGGVPRVGGIDTAGTVGDRATATAGFRDEFYGVAAAVGDEVDGPALVTSGLIDPGRCHWGARDVRVARRRYAAPRVELARLPPAVRRWADRQLVPKVLVASQTKVIEAVADPEGAWLPGVPVVSAAPHGASDDEVWSLAAALTNPVAASSLVQAATGSGLSTAAVRVSAKGIAALPWPAGDLKAAATALRAGDLHGCAIAALGAYGIAPSDRRADSLIAWWCDALPAAHH